MRNNLPSELLSALVYDETSPSCLRWTNHFQPRWNGHPTSLHLRWRYQKVFAHIVVWTLHHGDPGDMMVDHIDRDPTNNRVSNLRLASRQQNGQNSSRSSKSGYRGVYQHRGKWRVVIRNKTYGSFDTPDEAALHYNKIIKQINGDFSVFNSISG